MKSLVIKVCLLACTSLFTFSAVATNNACGKIYGTVKWYNPSKGFGFIVLNDGAEVFVHSSGLKAINLEYEYIPREGECVSLVRLGLTHKGDQAVDVEPAKSSTSCN